MTPRPQTTTWEVHGTGGCEVLDRSREEQESTGGVPCWVQAKLTMLQERSLSLYVYYAHDSARVSSSWYIISLVQFCTSTGVRKLLEQSREEQESARGEPRLVHARLTTLQERSCLHAHVRYSTHRSSSCYKFSCV